MPLFDHAPLRPGRFGFIPLTLAPYVPPHLWNWRPLSQYSLTHDGELIIYPIKCECNTSINKNTWGPGIAHLRGRTVPILLIQG